MNQSNTKSTKTSPPVVENIQKETKDEKLYASSYGVFILCILYIIPLGLIYFYTYYQNHTLYSGWILFFCTLGLIYLANLLFYRIYVMNDKTAKIDKMDSSTTGYVLGVTIMTHMIVGFTLFVITVYPGLIEVFENTIGMWGIGFFGLKRLANDIFYSQVMDVFKESDAFDYGFLVAQFNRENVDALIQASEDCKEKESPYMLDFRVRFTTQEQVNKLKDLINMKHSLGHFTWIYLSSIVSLFVSMIALLQK